MKFPVQGYKGIHAFTVFLAIKVIVPGRNNSIRTQVQHDNRKTTQAKSGSQGLATEKTKEEIKTQSTPVVHVFKAWEPFEVRRNLHLEIKAMTG